MNMTKETKSYFNKIPAKHFVVILLLFIFGVLLIFISIFIPNDILKHLCRDIGIAFLPLSVIAFVYEYVLRISFVNDLEEKVRSGIDDAMPSSLKKIRNSGIVDAYKILDIQNISEHINDSHNIEIKILDILFENLHLIKGDLLNAIKKNNCTIKVLLWNMTNTDVLERRSSSLGLEKGGIATTMGYLLENLKTLESIITDLENCHNPKLVENLEIKLYTSFVGVSLLGVGPDYYLGFYLRDDFSSNNPQLKISGYNRFFYNKIEDHFKSQWLDQTNKLFLKEDLTFYKNFFRKYLENEK
jgi:hypothetical protein